MAKAKSTVPIASLNSVLARYGAEGLPEYSNNKRHVYFSRPMQQYVIVRRKGNNAELEFTPECPCAYTD